MGKTTPFSKRERAWLWCAVCVTAWSCVGCVCVCAAAAARGVCDGGMCVCVVVGVVDEDDT